MPDDELKFERHANFSKILLSTSRLKQVVSQLHLKLRIHLRTSSTDTQEKTKQIKEQKKNK